MKEHYQDLKAQYFIFEDDTVFNIRGNEGAIVELSLLVGLIKLKYIANLTSSIFLLPFSY